MSLTEEEIQSGLELDVDADHLAEIQKAYEEGHIKKEHLEVLTAVVQLSRFYAEADTSAVTQKAFEEKLIKKGLFTKEDLEEFNIVVQFAIFSVETGTLALILKAFKDGFINKEDLKTLTYIDQKAKVFYVEKRSALLEHIQASLERKLHYLAKHGSELEVKACVIQAIREGLVKEDICKHLDFLHSEIPSTMRCRYLLQFVYLSLRKKLDNIIEHSSFPIPCELTDPFKLAKDACKDGLIEQCVLDYLLSLYPKFSNDYQQIKMNTHLSYLVQFYKTHAIMDLKEKVLALSNPFDIILRADELLIATEQISILYELLVKYAFMWDKIGIALNFRLEDLKNIQATVFHDPERCLYLLLEKWVGKKYVYALPPSIDELKKALNSQTVGLGSLVNELDKIFCRSIVQPALNPHFCIINVESSFPKSYVVHVEEGLSTLLEVQGTECEAYQWKKDGVDFPEDHGSTGPIVCLHQADIDWDGCELSCQVKHEAKTPLITVKVSCELDIYRTHLASMYLAQPEVPEDSWPPVCKLKYTNLALVKQEKVNYHSEYARLTIRGDLDDVLQDKQIIAYNGINFYKNLKSGNFVLIEGRPGSGKTTFVHKLSQDWAEKSVGSVKLLLLVSLRVINTFANPDLSDILKLFRGLQVSKDTIEQRLGKGVCFIFDGYDEFSPQKELSSVVNEIINKKYLPHSIVIVASRPAAIAKLRHKATTVLEVVGFLNEQIFEYIDRYPFKTRTKSAELKTYLEIHPNILHMCYLPIHATMVAFLFEVLGKVPRTETEIYTHFTRSTLIRSLTKNKEYEPANTNLGSLTGDEKICFEQICLLAFDKMLSNKQVLEQEEVDSHFQVKRSIDSSLGLITIDRTADLYGYKNIYTFMHLTLQEYLAARHITTLSDKEQIKLIQEYGDKNHMLVVWKFYCGLIKVEQFEKKFQSLLTNSAGNHLYQIQCGYETQQQILCDLLLKSMNYHITLKNKYLSTPDFTALGYVTNTTVSLTKLSLLNCNMNVEAIDALLSEMEDKARDSIHELHIQTGIIEDSHMECLKKLLGNLKSLKKLSLEAKAKKTKLSNITEESNITLSDLSKLSLVNVDIAHELLSFATITNLSNLCFKGRNIEIKLLSLTSNLRFLELSLDMNQFHLFCKCTQNWKKLQVLDASFESPDSEYLNKMLLDSTANSNKLRFQFLRSSEALAIKNCVYSSYIPMGLTAGLQWFPNLQKVYLSNNYITIDAMEEMRVSLCKFSCLKELQINSSHISNRTLKTLSSMFKNYPKLQKLSLSNNVISSEGCRKLAADLHFCSSLEKLSLKNNKITNAGASAVISSLKSCSQFQEVVLLQNPCNYTKVGDKAITFSILIACNKSRQRIHKELKKLVNNKHDFEVRKLKELWKHVLKQMADEERRRDQLKDCVLELRRRDDLWDILVRRRDQLQELLEKKRK